MARMPSWQFVVIHHDRHWVFMDAWMSAVLHHFVKFGNVPNLPRLTIKAQVLVFNAGGGDAGFVRAVRP